MSSDLKVFSLFGPGSGAFTGSIHVWDLLLQAWADIPDV